jgi:uncharacterized membrane protein YbhN (UPF0104 family)
MDLLLLEEIEREINQINSVFLLVFMLMMIINVFILLIRIIIVLFNGNPMQSSVKLLQVEMEKEIEQIN